MASAPFPGEESYEQITQPVRRAGFVYSIPGDKDSPIRGLVPSFYEPHEVLNMKVKVGGMPLLADADKQPFTIGEVPIELRWPIRPDGELMDQQTFERFHADWYEDWYAQIKVESPEARPNPQNYKNFPVPKVVEFVSRQPDPAFPHRYVPMHFDPQRTAGARTEFLEDGEGNRESREDAYKRAAQNETLWKRLTPQEQEEARALLGEGAFKSERERELEAEIERLKAGQDASAQTPPAAPPAPASPPVRRGPGRPKGSKNKRGPGRPRSTQGVTDGDGPDAA